MQSQLSGVSETLPHARWRNRAAPSPGRRALPAEIAIALVHDGATTAVVMASPDDLTDLAVGYTLSHGLVAGSSQIRDVQLLESPLGIEVRIWLGTEAAAALALRRRHGAGPAPDGLSGLDSLSQAARRAPNVVTDLELRRDDIYAALDALEDCQPLNRATRAVHAAAYWTPALGLIAAREDVGRLNALDKLAGALAKGGRIVPGVIVVTGRVCVEVVQKSAAIGAPVIVGAGAPTALAVRTAQEAGLTLVAAQDDGFEVFTHPQRLLG